MINSSEIVQLFKKYGFEYKKSASGKNYFAFTFKSGFFHNAELVYTDAAETQDLDKSVSELTNIGYSTKRTKFTTIKEIEKELFEGFFNIDDWRERIKCEYENHSKKMLSLLPEGTGEYSYVSVPYEKNDNRNSSSIISDLINEINGKGAKLLLLEAPAGFGKTCTSYEVINELCKNKSLPIPFFTEFSRDRQAKVFSHVFVREVDKSFTSVRSDLVIEETQNGKIVIVLDGFDELLNETSSRSATEVDFENAQPMLETIGDLLIGEAKIILTSRRSAMFDGEVFQEWLDDYNEKFDVVRYKLNTPEVQDWLDSERISLLENAGIEIKKLSNPVLLAYLKFIHIHQLKELCKESSKIIEHYFISMLEREQERQELRMPPEIQTKILSIIAADMCDKDYTSDNKDKIIDLIKNKAGNLLEATRKNYSNKERPTLDALANKLATHAFFDRSNQGENRIEFVNEFVFGNYISEVIISCENNDWLAADERFVEPAVLSYIPRNTANKQLLWKRLELMVGFVPASDRFKYEFLLNKCVNNRLYDNETITGIELEDTTLFTESIVSSSVFNECVFNNVYFDLKNFKDVTFISCRFYNCKYDEKDSPYEVSFLNCYDDDTNFISSIEEKGFIEEAPDKTFELERLILSKFMPVGSISIERLHIYTGTLYRIEGFTRKEITKAVKRLKDKNILENANKSSFTAINRFKVSDVKKILGREASGI